MIVVTAAEQRGMTGKAMRRSLVQLIVNGHIESIAARLARLSETPDRAVR